MTTTSKGKLEETALIPYDKLLVNNNGTLKVGRVTSIEVEEGKGGAVVLDSGERIKYDVLVLATGSHWKGPLNLPDDREAALAYIKEWRDKIESASGIVIAGGGAVGYEFAGEIKDFYPTKKVTIVHSGAKLTNDTYPDKFRKKLEKDIRARGVELVFEDFIDNLEQSGPIVTRKGAQVDGDLIIPSTGGNPATEIIASSLGSDALNERGQVRVKPTLQLKNNASIFAAGDIIDWTEQKQLAKYAKHADIVVANIISYLKDSSANKLYSSQPEMIVITNGVKGGAGYLGLGWGIMLGNWLSSTMKSKDLFVPMARKGLGIV